MKVVTTIKNTGLGTKAIYDCNGELIATACLIKKHDADHKNGKYRILIFGGSCHGKVAYASNVQDLNDKSVEILNLPK